MTIVPPLPLSTPPPPLLLALDSSYVFSSETLSRGGISLGPVAVPRLELGGRYDLWQEKPFFVSVKGSAIGLLPSEAFD